MSCYHPLQAYQSDEGEISFSEHTGGRPIKLACGQCIGCRIDRSRQWATRIMHEASLHEDNCFITLTYEHVPPDGSLSLRDYQLFMKRLRKHYEGKKIRFYHCGEYGDRNNRPHYHAILFGHNFDDWTYLFDSPSGHPIYTSPTLEKIWGKGFVTIGTVSFESAAYIARYVLKKITGKKADEIDPKTDLKPYERLDAYSGHIVEVEPEYSTMSRRPGIGSDWFNKYRFDCYPKDFTTVRGIKVRPPKYYDRQLRQVDPDMYDDIKAARTLSMYEHFDGTEERLAQKEKVKEAQSKLLKRNI